MEVVNILPFAPEYMPVRQSEGAAGFDCMARLEEPVYLRHGFTTVVPLGFSLEIPEGMEAQMRPRSGLAVKEGVTMVNCVGTIDSDFRGEVCAILTCIGSTFRVEPRMRIAQMIFAYVPKVHLNPVDVLTQTKRAAGAFGSTGLR